MQRTTQMSKKGIEWFAGTAANLRAYTYQYLRLIRIGNPKDESDLAVLRTRPAWGLKVHRESYLW